MHSKYFEIWPFGEIVFNIHEFDIIQTTFPMSHKFKLVFLTKDFRISHIKVSIQIEIW